jgi:hypothetical protein
MAFIKNGGVMQNCVNDFTPVIIAIASLLTVQVPAVVAMLLNQHKMKHDIAVAKSLSYQIDRKTDMQTTILSNGFHGPPGAPGAPGAPGRDSPGYEAAQNSPPGD